MATILLLLWTRSSAFAGSATWKKNPISGDWNTAANWTPATIPNGPSDTATFQSSNETDVSLSDYTEVDGIVFGVGANAFTITPTRRLTISGAGITNDSGVVENFIHDPDSPVHAQTLFANSATAGAMTVFRNKSNPEGVNGIVYFTNTSNAGSATFINDGAAVSGTFNGGLVAFEDTASAGNGLFTNNGGEVSGADGGLVRFGGVNRSFTTAANGTFINNGGVVSGANGGTIDLTARAHGGEATFINNGGMVSGAGGGVTLISVLANAEHATLIANGGTGGGAGGSIQFSVKTRGGNARVEVFGNGNLDISAHAPRTPVRIGSLEGDGLVFLGANGLSVGRRPVDTTFSGVIQDGGISGGTGGSFTKLGRGSLTLTGSSTYTGGTTIESGILLVSNATGSGTGTGAVQVDGGTLGGTGRITGTVTVGNGTSSGAIIQPGPGEKPGTLTIHNKVTFNSLSTYQCILNRTTSRAARVSALGVTINGATFSLVDTGNGTLTPSTVFTIINNTSANLIAGTFSNLADGSTFNSGGTTFKVNYEGGDGNDLTLTVQ